jgi:hypothetical protein
MKKKAYGPTKFSRRAKIMTSAFAVTSVLAVWNGIGHAEASKALVATTDVSTQIATATNVQQSQTLVERNGVVLLEPGFTQADLAAALQSGKPIELVLPSNAGAGLPSSLAPLPSGSGQSAFSSPSFSSQRSFNRSFSRRSRGS